MADVAALAAISVRTAGVLTATTRQSPEAPVNVFPADPKQVEQSLSSLLAELPVAAVKVGMVTNGGVAGAVADCLAALPAETPVVVDPVLNAGAGGRLADEEAVKTLCEALIPRAKVVTPNIPEAAVLAGMSVQDLPEMEEAADRLRRLGARYVLLKGGHLAGDPIDLLAGPEGNRHWRGPRRNGGEVHGTGCTLSALLAGYLALGLPVAEAADLSIAALRGAITGAWSPRDKGWKFLGPLPIGEENEFGSSNEVMK